MFQILTDWKKYMNIEREQLLQQLDLQYIHRINQLLQQKAFIIQTIQSQYDDQINCINTLLFIQKYNSISQSHHVASNNNIIKDTDICNDMTQLLLDVQNHDQNEQNIDIPADNTSGDQKSQTKQVSMPCIYCKKSFVSYTELREHISVKHDTLPYICQYCPRAFSLTHHVEVHETMHQIDKLHKCKSCVKLFKCTTSFATQSALFSHQRRVHIHGGNYRICATVTDSDQNNDEKKKETSVIKTKDAECVHVRNVEDDWKFVCRDCKRKFKTNGNLSRHKRIHTKDKPFQCNECDRRFARSDYLRKHVRIHTGDKPFQCAKCLKKFNSKSYLNRHYKKNKSCSKL